MKVATTVMHVTGADNVQSIARTVTDCHEDLLQQFDWVNHVTALTIPADNGVFLVFTGVGKLRTDES